MKWMLWWRALESSSPFLEVVSFPVYSWLFGKEVFILILWLQKGTINIVYISWHNGRKNTCFERVQNFKQRTPNISRFGAKSCIILSEKEIVEHTAMKYCTQLWMSMTVEEKGMFNDILLRLPITKIKRLVNFWIRTSLQPVKFDW